MQFACAHGAGGVWPLASEAETSRTTASGGPPVCTSTHTAEQCLESPPPGQTEMTPSAVPECVLRAIYPERYADEPTAK
eukprot:scaffold680361_cov41-Prasinocladus_malaysianus.AAC.1